MVDELRVLTKGSYFDAVTMRARVFVKQVPEQFAFATLVIAMFLLGLWFVRSGVMADTAAHLPLFRKLALFALPLGVGLGLIGSLIATYGEPGLANGFQFAFGLLMLGNLPACLGYVGVIVLMLNSGSLYSRISLLAPFGRMALTNYLTHSVVFTFIVYGYGLGYFGIERIWQFGCVVAMIALQIPLSHWWLARNHVLADSRDAGGAGRACQEPAANRAVSRDGRATAVAACADKRAIPELLRGMPCSAVREVAPDSLWHSYAFHA